MKLSLSRRKRLGLLKFIALLSIVRWYNILIVLIAQYFLILFALDSGTSKLALIANPEVHFMFFACGIIMAAGFIMNNFYDEEKDLVNRPKQTLFERIVSKNFIINSYLLFNIIGLGIGYTLSKQIFGFLLVFSIGLWLYSHKLTKKPMLGNVAASLLMVFPLLLPALYMRSINVVFAVYIGIFIMLDFVREIIKDLAQTKGDVIYGYQTLPVWLGIEKTKKLAVGLMFFSAVPLISIMLFKGISYLSIYFIVVALIIILSAIQLRNAKEQKQFERVNGNYKLLLITTVASLLFL